MTEAACLSFLGLQVLLRVVCWNYVRDETAMLALVLPIVLAAHFLKMSKDHRIFFIFSYDKYEVFLGQCDLAFRGPSIKRRRIRFMYAKDSTKSCTNQ